MKVHTVKYYEDGGVRHTLNISVFPKRPCGAIRGKISSCSVKSRRRLRRFLMENVGQVGGNQWALTLTVAVVASADQWRGNWRLFRQRVIKQSIPLVWRVELQERGTPHLHCLVWGGEEVCDFCRIAWLRVWGVENDPSHCEYAVKSRLADGGWYGYMILHNQKHLDGEGNCWAGRQWGVVNSRLFKKRDCQQWDLDQYEYGYFRRMVDRLYRRRGRKKSLPVMSSWDQVGGDRFTVAMCVERARIWRLREIAKVPF